MKNVTPLILSIVIGSLIGCGQDATKLTDAEKQEMKTLFKEGIKPGQMPAESPKTPSSSTNPNANAPAMNQPTDGGGTGQL